MKRLIEAIILIESLSEGELIEVARKINEKLASTSFSIQEPRENNEIGYLEYKFVVKPDGKRYGPYKHLRVWKNNKLTDKYLGKASEEEYATWIAQKKSNS